MKRIRTISSIIVFSIFYLISSQLLAQNCDQGYLATPDMFSSYCKASFINDINSDRKFVQDYLTSDKQTCWEVFSDRERNTLFHDPDGATIESDHLEYMERVAVKEVRGNWLLVYSPIYYDGRKKITDYRRGWIKASNLLLSNYSMLNEKSSPKKAMVLITIPLDESGKRTGDKITKEILDNKFYNKPTAIPSNENGKVAKKFDIYFIVKETAGAVLLSKADLISGSQKEIDVIALGWMPKLKITYWDHRVCLEVASSPRAVEYYGDTVIPSFKTIENLDKCIDNQYFNRADVYHTDNVTNERPDPYIMRKPILENIDQQRKKVATIAQLKNERKDSSMPPEVVDRKLQKTKQKLQNVNIVFVVDGTYSMSNYYPSIASSIEEIIRSNRIKNSNNILRFGLIVYRDYADGKDAYDVTPVTSNYQKIIDKVKTTRCFSKDNDLPEAQYNGIINGLPSVGLDKDHSNVLVLIGDAGNHEKDEKGYVLNDVVNTISEYECSMIAFQVYNGAPMAFQDFNYNAQDLLTETAKKYTNFDNNVELKKINVENTYKLIFNTPTADIQDIFMFGRFTYADTDDRMDTRVLEQNIDEAINDYILRVDKIKALLESIYNIENVKNVFTSEFQEFLKRRGFSEKEIEILKAAGDVTTTGYTSMQFYDNPEDAYQPVVFLSSSEKGILESRLKDLIKRTRASTRLKETFQNVLIELSSELLGDVSDEVIKDKSLDDIWNIILGVPYGGGNTYMGRKRLGDFVLLTDEEFKDFYYPFRSKAEMFMKNNYRDSKFILANQNFYWIPLSDLP